ncbi:unnamed protein product [Knipowitschia caucasica]
MPEWRSQCHLVLLNSLTCGLEICVAAATTYVPPLLLEAGVEERYMTMVLGIGPVLSLFLTPFVGSASDNCNSRYGRRRPFIWLLSLGVLIALLIIPNADILASSLFWGGKKIQVGFLILGVGLLDFCGHVCFTPLEALLSDLYREEEECGQAFAMFSYFIGEGLYSGVPNAAPGSVSRQRYDEGIRMGSLGLFMQCATSTVFSLIMSRLVQRFGSRQVYVSSMVSFTLCALVISMSKSVALVSVMAALTGFAYATIQTLPYTLTCHYHKEKEVYMPKSVSKIHMNKIVANRDPIYLASLDVESRVNPQADAYGQNLLGQDASDFCSSAASVVSSGHSPSSTEPQDDTDAGFEKRGVGLDFAILDSAFLISQVLLTLFMGMIVQFAQSVTAYMACSTIFGTVAIYFSGRIVYDQKDLSSYNML